MYVRRRAQTVFECLCGTLQKKFLPTRFPQPVLVPLDKDVQGTSNFTAHAVMPAGCSAEGNAT